MKICTHCTTENRDEAIFCRQCRHALQSPRTPEERYSKNFRLWLGGMFLLIGLTCFLLSPGSPLKNMMMQSPTPVTEWTLNASPAATQTEEPITLSACVAVTVNVRREPGTNYETIGGLKPGTCLTIIGRNSDASWAYIVSEDQQMGWVDVSLLNDSWGIDKVSVREGSAMANPGRATLTSEEVAYGAHLYFTEVAATNIAQAPLTQYVTPCFDMASRIGNRISCKIDRAVCDYLPAVEGSPTICNDLPYPDHSFALVVYGKDWSEYDRECIIVSGYLKIDKGVLQIQADQRSQIAPCK